MEITKNTTNEEICKFYEFDSEARKSAILELYDLKHKTNYASHQDNCSCSDCNSNLNDY